MPFEWIPIVAQENPIRIHNGPVDLISIRDLGKELLREAKDDEEDGINHGMHHLMDDVMRCDRESSAYQTFYLFLFPFCAD